MVLAQLIWLKIGKRDFSAFEAACAFDAFDKMVFGVAGGEYCGDAGGVICNELG